MLLSKLTTGAVGITSLEVLPVTGLPVAEIVKILIQVVIGVATLVGMFKRPKEVISNQNIKI